MYTYWCFLILLMITAISFSGSFAYRTGEVPIDSIGQSQVEGNNVFLWLYLFILLCVGLWFITIDRKCDFFQLELDNVNKNAFNEEMYQNIFRQDGLYNIIIFLFCSVALFLVCYYSLNVIIFAFSAFAFLHLLLHLLFDNRPMFNQYRNKDDYVIGTKFIIKRDLAVGLVLLAVTAAILLQLTYLVSVNKQFELGFIILVAIMVFTAYCQIRFPTSMRFKYTAIESSLIAIGTSLVMLY